jgi:hypothetical protein
MAQGHPIPVPGLEGPPGAIDFERVPTLDLQRKVLVWLVERAFGKTPDRVEVSEPAQRSRDLSHLSAHQLELVRAAVLALEPPADGPPTEH